MAANKINIFEKHVEKAVVAIAALLFIGILTWQFIGPPNSVKVGDKNLPFDDAFPNIAEKAQAIRANIERIDPPLPSFETPSDPLDQFTASFKTPVAPSKTLAGNWQESTGITAGAGVIQATGPIKELVVPVPATPIVRPYEATIDPRAVAADEAVAALVDDPARPDLAWVSLESTFNGKALLEALTADPDADGPIRTIPRHWWEGATQIVGIAVERQERKPDGSWTDPQPVEPLPSQLSLIPDIDDGVEGMGELRTIVEQATKEAARLRRPSFYPVWMGQQWLPPSEVVDELFDIDLDIEKERLLKQHERYKSEETKLADELKKTPDNPDNRAKRQNLLRRIERATAELQRLTAQIVALGGAADIGVDPAAKTNSPGDAGAKAANTPEPPLLDSDAVRLWAHDADIERGSTYRYRLTILVSNPIFGRLAGLAEEQLSLAEQPVVRSVPSAWSDPVTIADEASFFLTSAQPGDELQSLPRATAEVYVFRWGYWRRGSAFLEPGDPFVAEVQVPDMTAVMQQYLTARPNQGDPAPIDQPPPFLKEPVAYTAFLLDVAPATTAFQRTSGPGGAATTPDNQAFVCNAQGTVVIRTPAAEKATLDYQRVAASYRRGLAELQPKQIKPDDMPPPPTDKPDDREPGGPPGGGGGG